MRVVPAKQLAKDADGACRWSCEAHGLEQAVGGSGKRGIEAGRAERVEVLVGGQWAGALCKVGATLSASATTEKLAPWIFSVTTQSPGGSDAHT